MNIETNYVQQSVRGELDLRQQLTVRDHQLVLAAQAGSPTAFAELQTIYGPRLYATVVRITKNREDAEDALQDAFLSAYIALNGFEGRSSVFSWLTRIAINSALMLLRKKRRRAEVFFDPPAGDSDEAMIWELKDDAPNPEQRYAQRQRYVGVINALEGLEPKLRTPLQIQLTADCSMNEMSRMLGISVAAVKARLYRARRQLAASSFGAKHATKQYRRRTSRETGYSSAFDIERHHASHAQIQ
ncbi:MAG TPA: sigma-70 family RNA polymerase sigma factor [Terracidiphilus sp.]|nr:sigma-70 family RNA polymerase sigma factor [Terracidiphilus sp.]